jgi:signal transduction histidine kinase
MSETDRSIAQLEKQLRVVQRKLERSDWHRADLENQHDRDQHLYRRLQSDLEAALMQLRAAQAQLVQQEKMASLGALTAGIAHEIKNPLNFVNNFAGLSVELVAELEQTEDADERGALLADLKANAAKIEEHGKRADAIVRQMMEHARIGGGERRAVGVNALVEEYANHAFHGARARRPDFTVDIDLDLDADVGEATLIPQEIGRVLINLLDNAFDAVRERAVVEGPPFRPAVRVATRRSDGAVEIRVEDNGPGIPDAVRARIFEPFFTTKPSGQGTGLGLSLAYDIVTQGHRGTLAVESVGGEGANFRLVLPAS